MECSHNPTAIIGKPKWAVPVRSLKAVSLHKAKDGVQNASFTFYLDVTAFKKLLDKAHTGSKGDDMNDSHFFIFRDDVSCSRFASELRRVFYYAMNKTKSLPVEIKEDFASTAAGTVDSAHASVKAAAADGPVLSAPLTKFIKDGAGSHKKHFTLYPSAMIEWREDPKDAKAHRGMSCHSSSHLLSCHVISSSPPLCVMCSNPTKQQQSKSYQSVQESNNLKRRN